MHVIRSELFKKFPELLFGMSTKSGGVSLPPYGMNLSYNVGDVEENVRMNRAAFFREMGINEEQITFLKQVHSTSIQYSDKGQLISDCDAIYTDKGNVFLAVGVADCIPVFLYEPERKVVAAIHAGWRGTAGKIVLKVLRELVMKLEIDVSELIAYIGPGISVKNYEVGREVAENFNEAVRIEKEEKIFIDLKKENYNQLMNEGVRRGNIEVNEMCSYEESELLHSYRRDGLSSGRMLGVIGIRSEP